MGNPTTFTKAIRGTQRENLSKVLEMPLATFLDFFRGFFKAYLCKLVQVDLLGLFI